MTYQVIYSLLSSPPMQPEALDDLLEQAQDNNRARALRQQEGAEVRVQGAPWQEANELAMSLLGPADAFIHPFDDPLLWAGHASLVDEVIGDGLLPDRGAVSRPPCLWQRGCATDHRPRGHRSHRPSMARRGRALYPAHRARP